MPSNERKVEMRRNRRALAIEMLGGSCVSCGEKDIRLLQIDHINDDGFLDGAGSKLIARIILRKRTLDGLQLLCGNCHIIKTYHGKNTPRVALAKSANPKLLTMPERTRSIEPTKGGQKT